MMKIMCLKTYVSCSVIPVSGAILGPIPTNPPTAPAALPDAACDEVPWPLLMKLRMSVLVTRPFLPVPGTVLISIPSVLARCLTAGVDKALPLGSPDVVFC